MWRSLLRRGCNQEDSLADIWACLLPEAQRVREERREIISRAVHCKSPQGGDGVGRMRVEGVEGSGL